MIKTFEQVYKSVLATKLRELLPEYRLSVTNDINESKIVDAKDVVCVLNTGKGIRSSIPGYDATQLPIFAMFKVSANDSQTLITRLNNFINDVNGITASLKTPDDIETIENRTEINNYIYDTENGWSLNSLDFGGKKVLSIDANFANFLYHDQAYTNTVKVGDTLNLVYFKPELFEAANDGARITLNGVDDYIQISGDNDYQSIHYHWINVTYTNINHALNYSYKITFNNPTPFGASYDVSTKADTISYINVYLDGTCLYSSVAPIEDLNASLSIDGTWYKIDNVLSYQSSNNLNYSFTNISGSLTQKKAISNVAVAYGITLLKVKQNALQAKLMALNGRNTIILRLDTTPAVLIPGIITSVQEASDNGFGSIVFSFIG